MTTLTMLAHALLLPPTCLFLLIAAGLLLRFKWPRLGRACAASGLGLLFLFSTEGGARLLVQPLEALTAVLRPADRAGAQAIVVLAAGRLRNADEYGGHDIPDYIALARLRYAARLQHETGLPILVSGGRPRGRSGDSEAAGMALALREDFRTPVRWLEDRSTDTAQNAAFSAQQLLPQVRRILLVTDAMHMPRAARVFRQHGFEVVPAPTMFFSGGPFGLSQLMPSAEGLRRSYYATYEWIGLAWYRLRE